MGGFYNGVPRKLIKRVNEIEIDTHYYDNDVVPSNQELFTYIVDEENIVSTITGFASNDTTIAIVPYRIKYGDQTSNMYAQVTELQNSAFSGYNAILNITLPNTIHEIPISLFENCSNLEQCNIPKSVRTISSKAFKNCSKLDSLFIGTNVKEIANDAFDGCTDLDIICYRGSYAQTYAEEHNIPYSLISYVLDDDITKNSPDFVTSGTLYDRIKTITGTKLSEIYKSGVYYIETNPINVTDLPTGIGNCVGLFLIVSSRDELLYDGYSTNTRKSDHYLVVYKLDENNKPQSELWVNQTNGIKNQETNNWSYSYTGWSLSTSSVENTLRDKKLKNILETLIPDLNERLTAHTTNKSNVHDDTTFNNTNLTGDTTIAKAIVNEGTLNEMSASDKSLVNKKYVDILFQNAGGSSESNVNYIDGSLLAGWNTISLNTTYNQSWKFISKPYVFTNDGFTVDFRIKDTAVTNVNNNGFNTFKIYVPIDCNFTAATVDGGAQSIQLDGYQMDYMILKYYYTGVDGKDLDTVTAIENSNWSLKKTLGYGQGTDDTNNNTYIIKDNYDNILVQWGGDNTGGGTGNASDKYYESLYFNINAIQNALDEDIDIILYGTWYNTKINGKLNILLETYTCDSIPTRSINNKVISLSGTNLVETFNDKLFECTVDATSKSNQTYSSTYTPVCKLIFHKSTTGSNYRTVTVEPLS